MNEKFNKNAKVDKFTNMLGTAVRLIVIDPYNIPSRPWCIAALLFIDFDLLRKAFWYTSVIQAILIWSTNEIYNRWFL